MDVRIALAGNPNSGKTTLFNALTGSNQFVGNWPGVTVEKKEGKLKKHEGVTITDLPGIYSLSPYTLEEVVARNYLLGERPDAILNIIDGTNLERNLSLTTQLTALGIPVVVAINMMDLVKKNGDKINVEELSRQLGCKVVEISALKGTGVMAAAEAAIDAAKNSKTVPQHTFSGSVEHALAHIEEAAVHNMPEEQQRWYAIKIFERDDKVLSSLNIDKGVLEHIENDIKAVETEMDDDAESIITNERYIYIGEVIKACYKKKNHGGLSTSDRIDRIVTNRWLGLPIVAMLVRILATWTTNTGNAYMSGLAACKMFSIKDSKRPLVTMICGVLGVIMAIAGLADFLKTYISILGAVVPPIMGVVICDYWVICKAKTENWSPVRGINWIGIIAWVIGGGFALLETLGVVTVFSSALDGVIIAFVAYWILYSLLKNTKLAGSGDMTIDEACSVAQ